MKRKFWIGILISLAMLFFAVRRVDLSDLAATFRSVRYIWVIPAVVSGLISVVFRAVRWHWLLRPMKKIGFPSLVSATLIGLMANNLFPARLGEFVRAYAIGEKEHIGKSAAFATIVMERIFDGMTILLFLAVLLLFSSISFPMWLTRAAWFALVFYAMAIAVLVVLKAKGADILDRLRKSPRLRSSRLWAKGMELLGSFIEGLAVLNRPFAIVAAGVLSFLVWLPSVFVLTCLFQGFGFALPLSVSFFLESVLCLGIMIPSAPGYVGVVQFVCVGVLSLFGIPKEQALGFSIVLHASQFVPITGLGLIALLVEGFTLKEMRNSVQKIRTPKTP